MAQEIREFAPSFTLGEDWDETDPELRALAAQYAPYIKVAYDGEVLVSVELDEEAYNKAKAEWDAAEQARYDAEVWAEQNPYVPTPEPEQPGYVTTEQLEEYIAEGVNSIV